MYCRTIYCFPDLSPDMWHHFLWPIPFHRISSQAGLGSDIILPHALILNLMASPPYSYTDMYGTQQALPLSENLEEQCIPSGDPSSVSYIPRAARSVPHAHTVHSIHVKKITYPLTSRLLNSGCWKPIKMDWKRGASLKTSWATFNSLRIPELYGRWRTSGAFITKFNQFRHHRLRSHSTQCFHTQNIRMCNLDNPFQSFRTIRSFSNRVGDVLPTIILKALQHRYIGPLPALHLRHHRPGYFCDTVLLHTRIRHLRYITLDLLDLA